MSELTPEQQAENQAHYEAWVEDLTIEYQMIAIQRACSAMGEPATLNDDGTLGVDEDLWESEEFEEALHQEFLKMYFQEAFEELTEDGLIEPHHVDPDSGEIIYTPKEQHA